MAAISTHEPIGGLSGVLSEPLHAQAPLCAGPLPSRILHPDEQLQLNQQFYVPTVQPFMPYQFPTSSLCVPYSGFHGLGYSVMPLQLPSCVEVPGFITPQLQMLDYRRITPHVAPATAHRTRHSNFQNPVPLGPVMVNSEVQTEPICHSIGSHGPAARSDTCSESGRGTGCDSPVSTTPRSTENKSIACPEGVSVLTQNCNTSATETTDLSTVPKSEIIQAEQVQSKCGVLLSKHEIIQNKNNKMASYNKNDIMQCSLGSVQSSEDVVVCSYRSLAFREDKQRVEAGMLSYSRKHHLTSCTELNVLRTPSCTLKKISKPSKSVIAQCVKVKNNSETQFQTKDKDDGNSPNNNFKILRLPFDVQNHKLPCQLDASIWSVESLLPYVPSSEWLAENGLLTPQKTLSSLTKPSNVISKPYCVSVGKNLQSGPSAKYCVSPHQLEASIWSIDSLMPYVPSNEWMVENGFSTPQKGVSPQIKSSDGHSSTDGIPLRKNLQACGSTKYHGVSHQLEASIWSVDSLIPYVPPNELMVDNGFSTPQKSVSPQIKSSDGDFSTDGIPLRKNLQTCGSTKYHRVSHQLEASIWSVDSLMPYVPSNELMVDNGFSTPQKGISPQIKSSDGYSSTDGIPLKKNLQTCGSAKYHGVSHQLEASIWSVESLKPYVPSNGYMVDNGYLTSHQALSPPFKSSNVVSEPNQTSSDHFQVGERLQTCASAKLKGSIKSLEKRSPYRPSSSWLADFGNVYYYSKLPPVQQQSEILERWQPKVSLTTHLEPSFINLKKTRNQTPATGISDQKHCVSNKCKCKVKRSPRLSCVTLESKLPLCQSCRYDTKGKDSKKHSDCPGCKKEDYVEVKTFDKISNEGVLDAKNMALGNLLPECCGAARVELRQQTALTSPAQDKCGDLEWRLWEKKKDFMNQNKSQIWSLQKENAAKESMQASISVRRIENKESMLTRNRTRGEHVTGRE
uniref:Bucky ball 2-like n=1 Tax=Danio rerio TaxID=7955 RepID=R4GEN3_DANRE|nr:uncharacterized protein buc2l [Danio rerio]|eukprot:XP_003199627.1 uncharacterized protein buc2l [Danio rerio]